MLMFSENNITIN